MDTTNQTPAVFIKAAKISISISALVKSKIKYDFELEALEKKLEKFIEFDFFVMYQPSDGFVIVQKEDGDNAPLAKCIAIIEKHGCLSYDNYTDECI